MTNQLPIIITVDERDDIVHTALWPQCKEPTCPCHAGDPDDLWQDETPDVAPTEAELDAQELESDGTWVNGDEEDADEPMTSGPRRIDWSKIFDDGAQELRERDQERNVTHQCADGSWW
jgi:hypothetical protein